MWHFDDAGTPAGPISPEEMQERINAGRVTRATLVWRSGFGGWQPAGQTELAALFSGSAPPPPAAPEITTAPQVAAPAASSVAPRADLHYAGFWMRCASYMIDAIFLTVSFVVCQVVLAFIGVNVYRDNQFDGPGALFPVVLVLFYPASVIAALLYVTLFSCGRWQATPGKRLLGIHLMRADGGRLSFGRSLGRTFATLLSTLIFGIGFMMVGWTRQKRGLHDMICGTRAVYGKL
jgi:uncharacterized RDD family membrane protein YckC